MRKILVILLFIVISCAPRVSTEEIMNEWMNRHKSVLIKHWGPPDRITSDGKGGEIYIYLRGKNQIVPMPILGTLVVLPDRHYRQFYIDKHGFVYYWRAQG